MKTHYPWWNYIRAIIRAYPAREGKELSGVAKHEYEAVQAAIEATERMADGQARAKIIQLVHFDRTHALKGASAAVYCSERTAAYWQREFFEEVARNRGLLD